VCRYYESKFDVGTEDMEFRYRIAAEYTIGLCWVLRYYYQVRNYQLAFLRL
jgi:5'-3' exoribonuclease 2